MSSYQEVKDRSHHIRSSRNISKIISFDIDKAINANFDSYKRKRDNVFESYSRQSRYKLLDENEQRQRETELRNKINESLSELQENSIQNTIQDFKDTISKNYGKLIGLNLKDNQTQKELIIEQINKSIYEHKKPFYNFDERNLSVKKLEKEYFNYLDTLKTKLIEIAQSLKIANPQITNEYINDILPTNPEEAKTYLQQLLQSDDSGLSEEDRDKYSKLYFEKILVPFVQENAGKNPKAARLEIENLIKPESKILTERFKKYAEEYLPYLQEFSFDTYEQDSLEKAQNEIGFDPFATAKAKLYIKIAEQYDKENNYRMADNTTKLIEDLIK